MPFRTHALFFITSFAEIENAGGTAQIYIDGPVPARR